MILGFSRHVKIVAFPVSACFWSLELDLLLPLLYV
jgi:hypothetical protein